MFIGNGLGAEGADPSPTPDICLPDIPIHILTPPLKTNSKSVTPVTPGPTPVTPAAVTHSVTPVTPVADKSQETQPKKKIPHSDSFEISFTGKSKPLSRSNSISRGENKKPLSRSNSISRGGGNKANNNPAKKSEPNNRLKPVANTKSISNKKTPRDAKDKDKPKDATANKTESKNVTLVENKPNPSLSINSCTMSKVIEGDDFKITITSNAELQSCELSDTEGTGNSPKKKIVVTPKTPDKKEEKKKVVEKEVKKKNGKIPISKQYMKTRKDISKEELISNLFNLCFHFISLIYRAFKIPNQGFVNLNQS